jgi:hypothetical protein
VKASGHAGEAPEPKRRKERAGPRLWLEAAVAPLVYKSRVVSLPHRIPDRINLYFSDYFRVSTSALRRHGAFNISLTADLPLFIDPFLLFNSKKRTYRRLHAAIIEYLRFLRDRSIGGHISSGLIDAWYRFPEVKQTWLGFSETGNRGRGLGGDFARSLHGNLAELFSDFGKEQITKSSHLEKLCLIRSGVGRDNISDFTTNLILGFLAEYTQSFAKRHIHPSLRKNVALDKVGFNYRTQTWERARFDLPWLGRDYVLLVPIDLLTKDDTWINKSDLVNEFTQIPDAIPNEQLRAEINNYFQSALPPEPKHKDFEQAVSATVLKFPQLIDYYILFKEQRGDRAASLSSERVSFSERLYVKQFRQLPEMLAALTPFYSTRGGTYEEAHARIEYLKDVIENKGGHRIFYINGRPIEREEDIHILYRLTWFATPSDVTREANDGRGPVDFKISRGGNDKTLVEFKLAKNSQLRRNLQNQTRVYELASDARRSIKVIIYFSEAELERVLRILNDLKLLNSPDVVLIDARSDNKPAGSKA